ncbi:MAG: hypothetical protein QXQ50_10240, partial [Candidatus Bathyarchaeia archaeon]
MGKSLGKLMVTFLSLTLALSVLVPLASAAVLSEFDYGPFMDVNGVIEADRYDFMNADGNPLEEDIANAVFQGPGVFQRLKTPVWCNETIYDDSVGFMKDIYLTLTGYGTLTKMNYTGEEEPPYHWLPVIEQTPVGHVGTTPLEGWAIAYNMTAYPLTMYGYDEGYLVVTFSGFRPDGRIIANVIGQDGDDDWDVWVYSHEVWVNNPRLLAVFYSIYAVNLGSPEWAQPCFRLDIVVVFNKATKFVEIFQYLELVDIALPPECMSARFNMALARMAIFDANPWCDRAFYGWKNVTISDPEFFMVLSWTNSTLAKWVRTDLNYDYYGAYMVSYPVPDSWAIASTWYDSNDTDSFADAWNVWNAPQLRYAEIRLDDTLVGYLDKYVFLYMYDIDGDEIGDGDQALTRVEWYSDSGLVMPERLPGLNTSWTMVMYGVYDVNGDGYDGGEGGWFQYGYLRLSNGDAYEDDLNYGPNYGLDIVPVGYSADTYNAPPSPWVHTGTLGWLNGYVLDESLTGSEAMLTKCVAYLDIDQDGNKGAAEATDGDPVTAADEVDIPFEWWPTEELYWQLTYKFAPPVFKKIPPSTCCLFSQTSGPMNKYDNATGVVDRVAYDFIVLPAPGATTDAAGATWLNARFTSMLVTFDVEAYGMTATVGYTNPRTKMLPYLMLRLNAIPNVIEVYRDRRAHYLTADGRALPQMEWEDIWGHCETPWLDKHYLVVTVA